MAVLLRGSLVGLLMIAMGGCGYHLRGQGDQRLAMSLDNLHVEGVSVVSGFGRLLSDSLRANGVKLVEHASGAGVALSVKEPTQRREVLSVDSSVHAREYSLVQRVEYRVLFKGQNGENLPDMKFIEARRDLVINPNDAIGSDYEAARLRDEMNAELVDKLMFRLRLESERQIK